MTPVRKICPIILRKRSGRIELLAFEHPLAGCQLVKGTIERGESLEAAANRELIEESGLDIDLSWLDLGNSTSIIECQTWFFLARRLDGLPDAWTFHTEDDGGHQFRFFWHELTTPADSRWHSSFASAMRFVRERVADAGLMDGE